MRLFLVTLLGFCFLSVYGQATRVNISRLAKKAPGAGYIQHSDANGDFQQVLLSDLAITGSGTENFIPKFDASGKVIGDSKFQSIQDTIKYIDGVHEWTIVKDQLYYSSFNGSGGLAAKVISGGNLIITGVNISTSNYYDQNYNSGMMIYNNKPGQIPIRYQVVDTAGNVYNPFYITEKGAVEFDASNMDILPDLQSKADLAFNIYKSNSVGEAVGFGVGNDYGGVLNGGVIAYEQTANRYMGKWNFYAKQSTSSNAPPTLIAEMGDIDGVEGIRISGESNFVNNLGSQIILSHSGGVHYTEMQTGGSGDLAITPSGGDIDLIANLKVNEVSASSSATKFAVLDNRSLKYRTVAEMQSDLGITSGVDFVGATPTTDGVAGQVPAPTIAERNNFLKGDGTWTADGYLNGYGLSGNNLTLNQTNSVNLVISLANFANVESINGLTATNQFLIYDNAESATGFWTSSGSGHTLKLPSASSTERGFVNLSAQTFAGDKTFQNNLFVEGYIGLNDGVNPEFQIFTGATAGIGVLDAGISFDHVNNSVTFTAGTSSPILRQPTSALPAFEAEGSISGKWAADNTQTVTCLNSHYRYTSTGDIDLPPLDGSSKPVMLTFVVDGAFTRTFDAGTNSLFGATTLNNSVRTLTFNPSNTTWY